jgi:ELWxxDGT repeat protein
MEINLGQVELVKDIFFGSNGSAAYNNLTEFNNQLYFTANNGINGGELWVSDGTSAGTTLVKDKS